MTLAAQQRLLGEAWRTCWLPISQDLAALCDPNYDFGSMGSTNSTRAGAANLHCTDPRVMCTRLVQLLSANSMHETLRSLRSMVNSDTQVLISQLSEHTLALPLNETVSYDVLRDTLASNPEIGGYEQSWWRLRAACTSTDLSAPGSSPNCTAPQIIFESEVGPLIIAAADQFCIPEFQDEEPVDVGPGPPPLFDLTSSSSPPHATCRTLCQASDSGRPITGPQQRSPAAHGMGPSWSNSIAGFSSSAREGQFEMYWHHTNSYSDKAALAAMLMFAVFLLLQDYKHGLQTLCVVALLGGPQITTNTLLLAMPNLATQHRDLLVLVARCCSGITFLIICSMGSLPEHTSRLFNLFAVRLLTWGVVNPAVRPVSISHHFTTKLTWCCLPRCMMRSWLCVISMAA